LSNALPAALVASLALSACAVGPNFKQPAKPQANGYTREALATETQATAVTGGESQRFDIGKELPAQWWRLFESAPLDALIEQGIQNYPTIRAQQAALLQARQGVRAQLGGFFPQVSGTLGTNRQKQSLSEIEVQEVDEGLHSVPGGFALPGSQTVVVPLSELNSSLYNTVYSAGLNVSYTFDLFGGERRALENAQAQAEEARYQLEASYLTLTSNIASTAIQMASVREQIAATHEIIALEEKSLDLIQRQYNVGSRARADVLQQQSSLATVRATLPALQQQLSVADHQLAVLVGRFPHDAEPVDFELTSLKLPQDLPVSLPSALVEQRPDIKAQEMVMRQANALVGVATANLLPQLTLQAQTGDQAASLHTLISSTASIYSLATSLTQPIFEGGTLRAKRRQAIAAYDQAAAQYQQTVLNAFENVADSLTALENDALAVSAQFDAQSAAKASLDLIQRQYDAGAVAYVSLLSAQQAYQQARISYVQAVAHRYSDTVALFQALGGGWWNRSKGQSL
jgi:NodT family efflux transporter outer membrane factor (OMF) lipoprotein